MPAVHQIARATPATRDRFMDFLRAFSICAVVLGHYFIYAAHAQGGRLWLENAVASVPALWLATWLLQVMPLFFVVGGFANATALASATRRGEGWRSYAAARVRRLLRPAVVFAAAWLVVAVVWRLAAPGRPGLLATTTVPFGPLWFLYVYLAVILLAPVTLALHRRFGLAVPVALAAGVAAVDLARFGLDLPGVGLVNLLLVWVFAHQLGYFYADGRLARAGRRGHVLLAVSGLALLVALVAVLGYPRPMFGSDARGLSNQFPPTLAMVAMTLWLTGLAMLARAPLSRWLDRPRVWAVVVLVNLNVLTLFLWHMSAYLLVVLATGALAGLPPAGSGGWWLSRPLWIASALLLLAPIVAVFGRAERNGSVRALFTRTPRAA